MQQPAYLPMSRQEMTALGWKELDILFVSGDAYVDHPSFGVALLGRWLVEHGFRVGIVTQPRWENRDEALTDITCMGRPRLFAGIAAGAIDSMLAHYTAFRKKRHDDAYTPGGKAGARPNRACIVYTGLVRQAFAGLPLILGGIEASLRRISHYDFWTDSLRRSILLDSKADIVGYGMGESALLAVARAAQKIMDERPLSENATLLSRAELVAACRHIPGLVTGLSPKDFSAIGQEISLLHAAHEAPEHAAEHISCHTEDKTSSHATPLIHLPSHESIVEQPKLLVQATLALEQQVHRGTQYIVQPSGGRLLLVTPPAPALAEKDMDKLYALPYSRMPHPAYKEAIPAWEMIRTSITTHRGCGGGCSFCSLALHQGRRIASRSRSSILDEAKRIASGSQAYTTAQQHAPASRKPPRWAGSISDVGGPSANMWQAACKLPEKTHCKRSSCMHPSLCSFFSVDQKQGVHLLREINNLADVRHVRIASGVRFDLALQDNAALVAYTLEFTGGQLKVAPEHSDDTVLDLMRKPSLSVFEQFLTAFAKHCKNDHKEQYTVPYLMSAFPGCTDDHMRNLATWLKKRNWRPQQVQCFIPTPGTVATAMFYAGVSPEGEPLYVARTDADRLRQHHLLLGNPPSQERHHAAKKTHRQHAKPVSRDQVPRTKNRSSASVIPPKKRSGLQ